jgi:hypothetical protein
MIKVSEGKTQRTPSSMKAMPKSPLDLLVWSRYQKGKEEGNT